ncbi:hypothetical protein [Gordonia sp. N1V]|uniref:hypothetical protein n=1 Tax=Gordonia sp. N1V TaxID=3034163 RepID=UPI0023E2D0FB|nr:hypothetical protein [Gordonia sp. N1V]MDF3281684.1 hypothetical protein [Gordonia sp. N1V]
MTRHDNAEGTPPDVGSPAASPGSGGGQIVEGDQVSEVALQLRFGMGGDPIAGKPLGSRLPRLPADRGAGR